MKLLKLSLLLLLHLKVEKYLKNYKKDVNVWLNLQGLKKSKTSEHNKNYSVTLKIKNKFLQLNNFIFINSVFLFSVPFQMFLFYFL